VKKKPASTSDTHPTADEIRTELGRILSSPSFQRSKRLSELLRYVVTEALEGRGDRIKAVSIAIDVYGRDETFDSQNDTVVRVEAGRLRRVLEEYYREKGQHDAVLIEVPKGGYRPVFTAISAGPSAQLSAPAESAPHEPRANPERKVLYLIAAITAITLLTSIWVLMNSLRTESEAADVAPLDSIVDIGPTAKPFVMVLPLEVRSTEAGKDRLSFGLAESLITNLSTLSNLSVMAHASIIELQQESKPPSIQYIRRKYGITHIVRGSLERESNTVVVNVQLVDTQTGATVWAQRLTRPFSTTLKLEEELALRIATELSVQIQPDERQRLNDMHATSSQAWVLYRQGLIMLIPPNDMTRILTARQFFQRAQELDPDFAGGYAGESFSHSITVLFMKASKPELELSQALPLAKQAIAVDGNFGMGYATLSFAQLFAGKPVEALKNAQKAVTVQPGDAFVQFILGMNLIIAGHAEQAILILKEALRLDPLEPRTPYLSVLGIGYYAAGNYAEALDTLEYNRHRGGPRGPHMDIFVAASYAQLGREAEASRLLREVKENHPDFPVEGWITNWLGRGDQLQQTLDMLRRLGL